MKKYILFLLVTLLILSCMNNKETTLSTNDIAVENYQLFGKKVVAAQIYDNSKIAKKYDHLSVGDTITIAFTGKVNAVCKVKGCWMKVALDQDTETMVKFKDYGFFVPKDIENDTIIAQGKAFVTEMSVEDQRHFASDAGKTAEEIAAITKPKKTFSFIADGVLLKK
ncbi:DUF4920 domain-containing protein [Aquimarina sp. U1-2]|uniref:DUF4920 domain-containing protein n=1 Tax=Aquimarina sp. U1-2 TaxID=2823141 RepID=UPI001AECA927|nr:DUF4920 domain-containing protein [Aquimarina sp. U1-2]MBP2834179.1 DUF4920 domain-containing protein [Aquimarina sp. U1-2]